eukprot:3292667-Amphidinium_carterae.2
MDRKKFQRHDLEVPVSLVRDRLPDPLGIVSLAILSVEPVLMVKDKAAVANGAVNLALAAGRSINLDATLGSAG